MKLSTFETSSVPSAIRFEAGSSMSEEQIGLFRTILGEDILASYQEGVCPDDEGEPITPGDRVFILGDAFLLIPQNHQGKVVLGIEPYLPYAERPIYLYRHAVTTRSTAQSKLVDEFKRITSPIIQPPTQELIVPE